MNEQERQKIMILVNTIRGEINRMSVTDYLAELDTMADYAIRNIEKLQNMRYAELMGRNDINQEN